MNRFHLQVLFLNLAFCSSIYSRNVFSNSEAIKNTLILENAPWEEIEAEDQPILIPEIRGLVLLGCWEDVNQAELDGVEGFYSINLKIPGGEKKLRKCLEPLFLDQPLSPEVITTIKQTIILYYREHGHPLVTIEVPEQDITHGVLRLLIIESRLGKVCVKGNKWTKGDWLSKYITLKPNEEINERRLIQDLNFMNRNPFRRVDVIYTPGEECGTTDLELISEDVRSLRIYAGAENSGLKRLGRQRWLTGLNWNNALGFDHLFSYQYTTSSNFHTFQAHTGSYTIPFSWQHVLLFYGGYSTIDVHLPSPRTKNHGESTQASFRYDIPLKPGLHFLHELIFGFDFKRTNNTVEFMEADGIIDGNVNLTQLVFGYNSSYNWSQNKIAFNIEFFYSPGRWLPDQSNRDFRELSPFAVNHYIYSKASFSWILNLPKNFFLSWLMKGQLTNHSLLPSEQFGLGGYDTVRGYDERIVNTDNGYLLSMELHTPSIKVCKYLQKCRNRCKVKDALQFLAFIDFGMGHDYKTFSGEPQTQYLLGVGPGLRYVIDQNFSARVDLGFKLHRDHFEGGPTLTHFSVTGSF